MPKENAGDTRQSNIELLRILAMLAIIAHHYAQGSGFSFPADAVSPGRLWAQWLLIPGKVGVDCFVLISGWFLASARRMRSDKALRLWLQIFFYSLLFFVLPLALGLAPFSFRELAARLLPVSNCRWWFASSYFALFLLSPWLNRLLAGLDKRGYLALLLLLGCLWCLIPSFVGNLFTKDTLFYNNNLLWFVFLYALGGFLRRFPLPRRYGARGLIGLGLGCMLLVALSTLVLDLLGTRRAFFAQHATFLYDLQKLPTLLAAVLLFLGFSRLELGSRRWINLLSSAGFGVYLIHEDSFVRPLLWKTLFHGAAHADSALLIPYSLFAILAVYLGCTAIELARLRLLEKPCAPLLGRLAGRIDRAVQALLSARFWERFGSE